MNDTSHTFRPNMALVTKIVDDIMFTLHWGDLAMARSIPTQWYKGGVVTPKFNGNPIFKDQWKETTRQLRAALELPADYTGKVNIHIHGGAVVRTDRIPA